KRTCNRKGTYPAWRGYVTEVILCAAFGTQNHSPVSNSRCRAPDSMKCALLTCSGAQCLCYIIHSPSFPQEGKTMAFTKINIAEQSFNPFEKIGKQWMLISAGNANSWNTMTASWGGVGVIWGKPSATCYIRHSRYTM